MARFNNQYDYTSVNEVILEKEKSVPDLKTLNKNTIIADSNKEL